MKKITKVLFLTLSIFLNFGCNYEVYYKSVTDLSKVRAKTSMKPFEQINDPIVITMPVYEKMALFGNENMGTYNKRAGDMFVVYDWENNRIHDWCFFEGEHGWSNFRAVEMGTPVKYYDAGETIGCLSSDGKLTTYENPVMGTFTNLNNNQKVKSRYGILNTDGKPVNGKYAYRINIFDSETGIVNDEQIMILTEYSYLHFPNADKNGDYWITSVKNNSNYLNKIDCENNEVKEFDMKIPYETQNDKESTIISTILAGTIDKYVVTVDGEYDKRYNPKGRYPNIIVFDIEKEEKCCEISLPIENHPSRMYAALPVNEKLYGVFPADYDNDDWCECTDIYEIDIENNKTKFITNMKADRTESVYSRGNRIYLLSSRDLSKFVCAYYDVKTNEFNSFSITQEEILEM